MHTWRLIGLEIHNPAMNMAIDEAILTARALNRVPNTLRLYKWKPSAVSIGRNQEPQVEVEIDNCRRLGVEMVRRISGGGTVYHDESGEITYSLIAKTSDLNVKDIEAVYNRVYDGIRDALRLLGITADFNSGDPKNCPNLTVKGRKISGSSQTNKRSIFLQHGTLLLDVNLDKMFTLLRVPWTKSAKEIVAIAEKRITSIKQELGHHILAVTAANSLAAGFKNALGVQMRQDGLTEFEINLAKKLCVEKYSTDMWNFHGISVPI